MNSRNQCLKEKMETEQKKLDQEKRFRTLRLRTVDEMKRSDYVGNPTDEQGTLIDIIFKYLKKIGMSMPNGKNTHECVYLWRHGVISSTKILEAFEYYLDGQLTEEFEACRGKTDVATKANVGNKISELKRKFMGM